jgi:hypothetical protein
MSKVSDVDNAMTPEQRQKALKELQKSDSSQTGATTGTSAKQ